MQAYIPINCSYYDELEALATRKRIVPIIYRKDDGEEATLQTRILDFYTRNKEEFMVLEAGPDIRLDKIVSVDGKIPPLSC